VVTLIVLIVVLGIVGLVVLGVSIFVKKFQGWLETDSSGTAPPAEEGTENADANPKKTDEAKEKAT
jgi:hypothetical protein